ncbi:MAG: response regulator transcription factor [Deltaproteobacteria bacterium]|nr:response regulator transcription factor [Deltaproteobacteria bacterium]
MGSLVKKAKLSGKKILIADDSTEVRDALSTALDSCGATVIEAKNGMEALSLAVEKKPDMIIMDINMPEMNGLDACRSLKSGEGTKNIPILLSSSDKFLMETATSKMSIADDYLSKPFSLRQLIDKAARIICPS